MDGEIAAFFRCKRRSRRFIASVILWLVSFALGIWLARAANPSYSNHSIPNNAFQLALNSITTASILKVNLIVTLMAACGIFTFGLTTLAVLLPSGAVTGLMVGLAMKSGIPVTAILAVTMPHCIELAGLWLACTIGFIGVSGRQAVLAMGADEKRDWPLLARMCLLSLGLTILAAVIEGEFTLKLMVKRYA